MNYRDTDRDDYHIHYDSDYGKTIIIICLDSRN